MFIASACGTANRTTVNHPHYASWTFAFLTIYLFVLDLFFQNSPLGLWMITFWVFFEHFRPLLQSLFVFFGTLVLHNFHFFVESTFTQTVSALIWVFLLNFLCKRIHKRTNIANEIFFEVKIMTVLAENSASVGSHVYFFAILAKLRSSIVLLSSISSKEIGCTTTHPTFLLFTL